MHCNNDICFFKQGQSCRILHQNVSVEVEGVIIEMHVTTVMATMVTESTGSLRICANV